MANLNCFKIETGIPLPERTAKPRAYPFADMSIGDSVFFATDDHHRIRAAASYYGKKYQMQFVCRNIPENNVNGVRVWRKG